MVSQPYSIPAGQFSTERIITKSRFIATIQRIQSLREMRLFVREMQSRHPKANHNCWGVIAGTPGESHLSGCSDDGEPAGTAGKPILNVLSHSGLGQTGLVVSRYFGGIKLGKGGLVRAYGDVAKAIIKEAKFELFVSTVSLQCTLSYSHEKNLRYLMQKYNVTDSHFTYCQHIVASLSVDSNTAEDFKREIRKRFGQEIICMTAR